MHRRIVLLVAVLAAATIVVMWPVDGTRHPPDLQWVDAGTAGKPNVAQLPTPWLPRGCRGGCQNAYLKLVANYARRSRGPAANHRQAPLSESDSIATPATVGQPGGELAQRIIDGLAIDFLLDGLAERGLAVALIDESRSPAGVTRRRLLFWDPAVGSFDALLLLPPGEGPFPAVVGLHGHRDKVMEFADEYLGDRLARNGIAVLVPQLRAHDCSLTENRIARALLGKGFTLIGLRVYETLLMHKYLKHLEAVDARRVGLLSHSGGSSTANLVVRVSDKFRAHVADYQTDYQTDDIIGCGPLDVHCETVPALVPLAPEINNLDTLAVRHLQMPYKFPDPESRRQIMEFFRRHLAGAG